MRIQRRLCVGFLLLTLSLGLACGDDTDPVSGGDDGGGTGDPPKDTTAPQTIVDMAAAWRPSSRDVAFTWTAPRDDDDTDHVARYDIRYAYSFPFDWDLSVPTSGVPNPEPEGTAQSYALAAPLRGRDLYVAARTFDAAGNRSPIGPVVHLYVPGVHVEVVCTDIFTGAPVEGLDALLTTDAAWSLTSDADGRIYLDNVTGGTMGMEIQSGAAPAVYHTFQNTLVIDDDTTLSVPMIPVIAADYTGYDNVLQIVVAALVNGGAGKILKRWNTYPVPWYAPSFTNTNGLDYTELSRQAAAQWNVRTGLSIFSEVGSLPANGIEFKYLTRAEMGIQNGYTSHTQDAAGFPAGEIVRIVDDFSDGGKLYSILMHELGHCIRLGHLPQGFLMFAGQPLPSDITDDEVRTVQMMLAIPNGTDLAHYDLTTPLP